MSEIHIELRPRPEGWADLPALDEAQTAVVEASQDRSLVVRGAPGSGRTTCALAALEAGVKQGQSVLLLVPDRVRADRLSARAQALAPHEVRPVRTPASFAHRIVTTWRLSRADPLAGVELVTGALFDEILARLIEQVDAPWPESMPAQMRAMEAFRAELRDLFARAGEAGLDADSLEEAGKEFAFPQWVAAAALLRAYLDAPEFTVEHRDVLRVDLARIQTLAAELIENWDARGPGVGIECGPLVPDLVIVDDLQDCTPSTIHLLHALEGAGARILAFADPDVAVASYRGGEPHLDLRLAKTIDAEVMELAGVKAQPPRIRRALVDVVSGITQSGPHGRRRVGVEKPRSEGEGEARYDEGSIIAHLGGSNAQLGAHIAHALRRHHLHEGIPWDKQAVIVRSASAVHEFTRHLRRGGVPVNGASRAFDFAAQASTRVLLELIATPDDARDPIRANTLIASPLVSCDALEVHRLLARLSLVNNNKEMDGEDSAKAGRALSVRDLLEGAELRPTRDPAFRAETSPLEEGLDAAAKIWAARAGAWRQRPQEALWRIWQAAGVADSWKDAALARGEDSNWYDDQLDAVVALMRVADVWEQRNPGKTAADFAKDLLDKGVPVDTIARVSTRPAGVSVLTPAQAMGAHFEVVSIIGLQEGAWPNTRLRTRALRADLLADLGAGRFGQDASSARVLLDDPRQARRAVLDDERRLLAAALSRCTRVVHIGAVSAENDAPSLFFHLLAQHADTADQGDPQLTPAPAPLNLAGQVADLRRAAAREDEAEDQETAIILLALLSKEGIRSADPDTWTGEGPLSSDEPINSGLVHLSPSRIEAALNCPLRWFLSSIGAEGGGGAAQSLGTLLHALAEELPHGREEELLTRLESKLAELDIDTSTWEGLDFSERARKKAQAFAAYCAQHEEEVEVEKNIRVQIGQVMITGRLDRIEKQKEGVVITDLKTGAAVRKAQAKAHPQLAVYQLALRALGYEVADAKLVFLLDDGKAKTLSQGPLDEDQRAQWLSRIEEVGTLARASTLNASPEEQRCATCPFTRSCPAHAHGRRTVD